MQVKIYRPSKNTMQSGRGNTGQWVLEYETVSARNPEPLMGWTASGDTLNQVRLRFSTMEEAVAFAEREGWDYTVMRSHDRTIKPRNYGDNFKYIPPETQEKA
ncbi:MAG: ETC complex I subunit [Alphaproteobacteria bacterium]|nr:ETC complex I subunit [Alphaproteobacteria bacterium]